MGRNKGCPKTGGRVAGTPNKITADMKNWVYAILTNGRVQFEKDLKSLPPIERVKIYTKLLGYIIPRASIEQQPTGVASSNGLTIIVENNEDKQLIEGIANLN